MPQRVYFLKINSILGQEGFAIKPDKCKVQSFQVQTFIFCQKWQSRGCSFWGNRFLKSARLIFYLLMGKYALQKAKSN